VPPPTRWEVNDSCACQTHTPHFPNAHPRRADFPNDLEGAQNARLPHDQIINPSREINEQFAPVVVTRENGDIVSGVVVNFNGDTVTLNTDLSAPNQRTNIDRKKVKSIEVSKVSPMPPMLLNMLTLDEILDLVAYALSGGNPDDERFRK